MNIKRMFSKKRIVIGFVFILFVVSMIIFRVQSDENEKLNPETDIQKSEQNSGTVFEEIPSGRLIEINGVSVNNFFDKTDSEAAIHEAVVVKNNNYQIVYQNQFNQFIILITGVPFSKHRAAAEKKFLEQLGVNKEEACLLNVSVTTVGSSNPIEAGEKYEPSFCN